MWDQTVAVQVGLLRGLVCQRCVNARRGSRESGCVALIKQAGVELNRSGGGKLVGLRASSVRRCPNNSLIPVYIHVRVHVVVSWGAAGPAKVAPWQPLDAE